VYTQRFRFGCTTAATNKTITFQNLCDLMGVAITATSGYDLFDQVRMSAVEVWALPVIGASTTVSVAFGSNYQEGVLGDGRVHSDNSMGIEPAHVLARPSTMSQIAQWQVNSAAPAFSLSCPIGSVIDVILAFRTISTDPPTAMLNALVGATVGDIFYRGLDGLATATTTLPAVAPVTN
jgi:hypothetical protein